MAGTSRALGARRVVLPLLRGGARDGLATQGRACRAPLQAWTPVELHLGRDINGGGTVSERDFRRFVDELVTLRFPDGLGSVDCSGQYRQGNGVIVREPSKLLTILVPDAAAVAWKVRQIIAARKRRFRQESVLHAEIPVCVAFGCGRGRLRARQARRRARPTSGRRSPRPAAWRR